MKLRLKGNSIRLRLGPAEVRRLLAGGALAEAIHFGSNAPPLGYTLVMSAEAMAVTATFAAGQVRIMVPAAIARGWAAAPEQVEIAAEQDAGGGRRLAILIEKDFECLHGEEVADAYPRPERSGAAGVSKGVAPVSASRIQA